MKFLQNMRSDWNISLFHYRNHGADYGRVLVGMQVQRREREFHRVPAQSSAIRTLTKRATRLTGCSSFSRGLTSSA